MKEKKYIPAARFQILTPIYDILCSILGLGKNYRERVIKTLQLQRSDVKVLDAGCGTGNIAIEFKQANPRIELHAVDADNEILTIAKERAKKLNLDINFRQSFLQKLPYKDKFFDIVYSSLVFHHLNTKSKNKAMKEICRVLKKKGKFYLFDFGKPKSRFSLIAWFAVHLEEGYDNIKGNIPSMLLNAGFKSVKKVSEYRLGIYFLVAEKATRLIRMKS